MAKRNEHTENRSKSKAENAPAPRLLTIDAVASILSVGRTTVYKLTQEGKLTSLKLRNCVRYKSEDVDRLITELENTGLEVTKVA